MTTDPDFWPCHHGPCCDRTGLSCGPGPRATVPVPEASFSCAAPGCAEHCTYPADMLAWWDGQTVNAFSDDDEPITRRQLMEPQPRSGWYCDSCREHYGAADNGVNLMTHIQVLIKANLVEPLTLVWLMIGTRTDGLKGQQVDDR